METLPMITTILVALLTAVVGPIAVEWAKRKFAPSIKPDDVLQEAIEYNDIIDQQLEQIIEYLDCGRVLESEFSQISRTRFSLTASGPYIFF